MSGIHWGVSINQHDMQMDSINSTSEIKKLFIYASIPLFLGFFFSTSLVFGAALPATFKIGYTFGILALHMNILYLDYLAAANKKVP